MERVFDVLFSGFALLVLFPLLVSIVIILRCSEEVRLWATRVNMWRLQHTLAL
jgi:lipopolysaccharide/colanic/teichoic acid biosynthesis glycosyltransferase